MSPTIRIFQIYYDEKTRATLDPAFEPLDNMANERPDWFEYWPIRKFLENNVLEDETYYGFLSPRFHGKTKLTGEQVRSFVLAQSGADIVTFSPTPDWACVYISPFEQGEAYHPGLFEVSQAFFDQIGMAVKVTHLVLDVRSTVFCNYFVAKGSLWRRWKNIFDHCFELAENPESPLGRKLSALTEYKQPAQLKIFLMERVMSMLLATDRGLKVVNYPPFELPPSHESWQPLFDNLVVLDSLKASYLATEDVRYMNVYVTIRQAVNEAFNTAFPSHQRAG